MNKLKVSYTNWRGVTSIRTITPIKMRFGSNEWHVEDQWLMLAYDHDIGEEREFAMKDMSGRIEKDLCDEW